MEDDVDESKVFNDALKYTSQCSVQLTDFIKEAANEIQGTLKLIIMNQL